MRLNTADESAQIEASAGLAPEKAEAEAQAARVAKRLDEDGWYLKAWEDVGKPKTNAEA